jgi:hypothetical protein
LKIEINKNLNKIFILQIKEDLLNNQDEKIKNLNKKIENLGKNFFIFFKIL